ncbi:MAG: hypothetical protein ACE5HC_14055 [Candidatus Binatia bacterium]
MATKQPGKKDLSAASGTDMKVEVAYDDDDRVASAEILGEKKTEAPADGEEQAATADDDDWDR